METQRGRSVPTAFPARHGCWLASLRQVPGPATRGATGGTPGEGVPPTTTRDAGLCQPVWGPWAAPASPLPYLTGIRQPGFAPDPSLGPLEQPPLPACGEGTAPQRSPRLQQEHGAQAPS